MKDLPTWSVVVTAKAPLVVVKAFVAHHLELGASEIFIFFDDPNDQAFSAVSNLDRVTAYLCDDGFWQTQLTYRPDNHRLRQIINASIAQRSFSADWLCHLDIDEFLHADVSVFNCLSEVPDFAKVVRISPAENVSVEEPKTYHDVFSGAFRKKIANDNDGYFALTALYGSVGSYFTHGLQGHTHGKVFVAQDADSFLRIHDAFNSKEYASLSISSFENIQDRVIPFQSNSLLLLHFFSMGYADWSEKHLRRLEPTRFKKISHSILRDRWDLFRIGASKGETQLREYYENFNVLTKKQKEMLITMNAFLQIDLGLQEKVQKIFGDGDHGFNDLLPTLHFEEILTILKAYSEP